MLVTQAGERDVTDVFEDRPIIPCSMTTPHPTP